MGAGGRIDQAVDAAAQTLDARYGNQVGLRVMDRHGARGHGRPGRGVSLLLWGAWIAFPRRSAGGQQYGQRKHAEALVVERRYPSRKSHCQVTLSRSAVRETPIAGRPAIVE